MTACMQGKIDAAAHEDVRRRPPAGVRQEAPARGAKAGQLTPGRPAGHSVGACLPGVRVEDADGAAAGECVYTVLSTYRGSRHR